MADSAQQILTLLSTNWTAGNTDSITPTFIKIVHSDYKRARLTTNSDFVIVHVPTERQEPAGIGTIAKHRHVETKLDIRVFDEKFDNYTHFRKVVDEIIRILDSKIVDPITGWNQLTIDGQNFQDLSDKRKGIWRMLIPVALDNWNVPR